MLLAFLAKINVYIHIYTVYIFLSLLVGKLVPGLMVTDLLLLHHQTFSLASYWCFLALIWSQLWQLLLVFVVLTASAVQTKLYSLLNYLLWGIKKVLILDLSRGTDYMKLRQEDDHVERLNLLFYLFSYLILRHLSEPQNVWYIPTTKLFGFQSRKAGGRFSLGSWTSNMIWLQIKVSF